MTQSVTAVILAGGQAKPDLVAATGFTNRALIPVNGKPMLEHVVDALRGTSTVGSIRVVSDLPPSIEYESICDHGGFVENVFAGIAGLEDQPYALVATADLPFLTGAAVEDFVARGTELGADIVYPVVLVSECYARFPGIHRTSIRLREGEMTGGNLMLVRPVFLNARRETIAAAYAMRKQPIRLAIMFGPGTLARFALTLAGWPSLLTIPRLERTASRLIGGTARALISPYPEIATDIDKPEDLAALK